jgi:hypothetical protein
MANMSRRMTGQVKTMRAALRKARRWIMVERQVLLNSYTRGGDISTATDEDDGATQIRVCDDTIASIDAALQAKL